jgi:hypothetical protein
MHRSTSNKLFAKVIAGALASVIAISSVVMAAPSATDIATARELVVEGRKLRAAGEFAKAVEKLKVAYALYPTPVTGDELALGYRDAGKLIEARETALRVVKMPVESDEGKASEAARASCSAMVNDLGPKIGQVTLAITGVPSSATPTVTIDGEPVNAAVLGEPRAINPGKHVAVVTVEATEKRVEFEMGAGEKKTVTIAVPEVAAKPVPTVTAVPTVIAPPPPPPTRVESSTGWLTYTGFGVAGVGLAIGTITGLSAMSSSNKLILNCTDGRCPSSEESRIRGYDNAATISTVSFILAGVGLTVGIIDLATGATATKRTVSVSVGPASAYLVGSF